jgi:predicted dehydrogenase
MMKPPVSTQRVRTVIIGLSHGHVIWILPKRMRADMEFVGFYEPNTALAERYSAQFDFPLSQVYSDLGTMLDELKPEAGVVFGSIYDHLAAVEACAPRGIHVMVEKPLAVSSAHAERMASLARQHGIHLITNYETTWYASTYAARQAIESGPYGPIRKIVVHDGHQGPAEIGVGTDFLHWLTDPVLNGGGAVIDFGCYGANLCTWLMHGQAPKSVTAVLQTLKPKVYAKVDDEATILLTYEGAQAIIQASWNWPVERKDMEIYAQNGYVIAVDALHLRQRLRGEPAERALLLDPVPERLRDPFAYLAAVVRGEEVVTPGNLWSLENNLTVVRILDAARESARTGTTIHFA